MSSINLTNLEIDAIKLPQLNSFKLFSPELLFTEEGGKDEIARPTKKLNKLEKGKQTRNCEKEKYDDEDDGEKKESGGGGIGKKRKGKEKERETEGKENVRKVKKELKNWMENSKIKKNNGLHSRKGSDSAQVIESKNEFKKKLRG